MSDKPPPYPFPERLEQPSSKGKLDDQKNPSNCSQWSEQQVADAVSTLGPSKAWKRYAALCIEEELDGPTMMEMSVDDLVSDYQFKKPHAKLVVKHFQPQSSTPAPAQPIMGLTEVAPLVDLAAKARQAEISRVKQPLSVSEWSLDTIYPGSVRLCPSSRNVRRSNDFNKPDVALQLVKNYHGINVFPPEAIYGMRNNWLTVSMVMHVTARTSTNSSRCEVVCDCYNYGLDIIFTGVPGSTMEGSNFQVASSTHGHAWFPGYHSFEHGMRRNNKFAQRTQVHSDVVASLKQRVLHARLALISNV